MKGLFMVAIIIMLASEFLGFNILGFLVPIIVGYIALKLIGAMFTSGTGRNKNNWWI